MIIVIRESIGYLLLAIYVWMAIYNQFPKLFGSQEIGLFILFLLLALGAIVLFSNYLSLLKSPLGAKWHWLRKALITLVILLWLVRYDFALLSSHAEMTLLMLAATIYSIWWGALDQLGKKFEIHGAERKYILLRDPPERLSDLFTRSILIDEHLLWYCRLQ